MELEAFAPDVELPFERPLFSPAMKPRIADRQLQEGASDGQADALFEQVYVDKARLAENVRRLLQTRRQVSLAEIVDAHRLEQGLAELVAYLSLASEDRKAVIDDRHSQTLAWTDAAGDERQATLPLVIFQR